MARTDGKITQRHVAEEAGVSTAAVSAVLSGQASQRRIAAETVRQVRMAVQRLNYRPTRAVGEKKLNHMIGLILRGRARYALANPYYGEIFHGVEEVLNHEGFAISIAKVDDGFQSGQMARLLAQRRLDGLILLGELSKENLNWLSEFETDVVSVNFIAGPNVPSVSFDFAGSRALAMRYLASRGHTRVAFLSSSLGSQNSLEAEEGYRSALRPPQQPLVIYAQGGDLEHAQAAVDAYLSALAGKQPEFTCILAESDTLAGGAVLALKDRGFAVPSQISVMGGQDLQLPTPYRMELTTTSLDKVEMGRLAARYLLGRLRGENAAAVRMVMPTAILERKSVASLA